MWNRRSRIATALLLPLIVAAPSTESPTETGIVGGRVTDARTGQPLAGIQVSLPDARIGALTNQAGRLLIVRVPFGKAMVLLEHACYHPVMVALEVSAKNPERRIDIGMPYDAEMGCEPGRDRGTG